MASSLPLLPAINDVDLLLDVFTHESLKFNGGGQNDTYGDTSRLAQLGSSAVDLSVKSYLFMKRPMKTEEEIEKEKDSVINPDVINSWLEAYQLKKKLRFNAQGLDGHSDELWKRFFHTYVGAIYYTLGFQEVQKWILSLLDVNKDSHPMPSFQYSSPPQVTSPPPSQSWANTQPMPPPSAPPPIPPIPSSSANLSLVTLALVNQTAAQRGLTVTYPSEATGPPHAPIWTVRCLVNGIEKGIGIGKNTKLAKEEAARNAWVNMGW